MKIKRNVMINKAGGNAGKSSVNYRISLPAEVIEKLNITPEEREVILEWDDVNNFLKIYKPYE